MTETYGCGSGDPTLVRPGNSCFGTAESRVVEVSERDRNMLDQADDVDWPGGGSSCSREVAQVERQQESMAQLELVDESFRWGRESAAVRRRDECKDRYRRGEQRGSSEVCSCASS